MKSEKDYMKWASKTLKKEYRMKIHENKENIPYLFRIFSPLWATYYSTRIYIIWNHNESMKLKIFSRGILLYFIKYLWSKILFLDWLWDALQIIKEICFTLNRRIANRFCIAQLKSKSKSNGTKYTQSK